jgi:hypothetical protein
VWGINLVGYRLPNLRTEGALEQVCGNRAAFTIADRHQFVVRDFKRGMSERPSGRDESPPLALGKNSKKMVFSELGAYQELNCVIFARAVGKETYLHAHVALPGELSHNDPFDGVPPAKLGDTDPDVFTPRWTAYPGQTLLKDMAGGSVFAPPDPAQYRPTLWDHNGSIVRAVSGTANFQILYEQPRKGMLTAGAGKGSALFQGVREGSSLTGSAYIFNAKCGPSEFRASESLLRTDGVSCCEARRHR